VREFFHKEIRMKFSILFALVLFGFGTQRSATAGDFRLKLVSEFDPKEVIEDLRWDQSRDTQEPLLQVKEKSSVEKKVQTYFVILQGSFQKKHRNLIFKNKAVALSNGGRFSIEVQIQSERQEFTISEVDEAGNVSSQKFQILCPEWEQITSVSTDLPSKKWSVSPGVGFTVATYQQTGITSFTETALTLKVAADYAIAGPWDIGVNAYYAMLPITTSQKGVTLTFLGLNLRTGFRLLKPESSWGLSIMGGIYYATTFTSGAFGYQNVQGPQIYPVLRRKFSGGKSGWLYLKYSPIFDGTDFVSLSNSEIAIGGGYTVKAFSNGSAVAVSLDLALLSLQASSTQRVQSNTYSIGANYRF
jgi:hypothetical protein